MNSDRLLLVSNRLPVEARATAAGLELRASDGGLASGLRARHVRGAGRWIGWPGDLSRLTGAQREQLDRACDEQGLVPVHLSREQVDRYYHGFSNGVLWPLFHYLIDRVPVDAAGWDVYRQVNERFADVVAGEYRPGDTIWVHDYQLMLLPELLRARCPDARIGFFLHIPFPSSEVFRVLPWRRELLRGLLGADVLGFHTFSYLRHFITSLLHVDGVETDIDRVRVGGRDVRLGVFPMGIDAGRFAALARDPAVATEAAAIRADAGGRQVVLGIDRLDYTKGIPRRLQAIQRLLEREPALRDRIRYVQIAVPSRGEVDSYRRFKRHVEEAVGRINGGCGTVHSTPVHYVHQAISERELVALYLAADVMLVTPLRDGMNLVAKEFVASRVDGDGVLVLSEFAGAAAELEGALVVNPYDVDAVATTIHQALRMAPAQRAARMKKLRRRVAGHDVHAWAAGFLRQLEEAAPAGHARAPETSSALLRRLQAVRGGRMRLLLDYDGTLVPFASAPELAAPDRELLSLLGQLASAGHDVHIVSGRPRVTLERWLGHLPLRLWAEHGFWYREGPGQPWQPAAPALPRWGDRVRAILQQFTDATPGARIEEKSAGLAWHYRNAPREFGARQAHELRMLLGDALSNQPFEVLEGKKVIEVRLRGINKGLVVQRVPCGAGEVVLALGDDRTDEDLFRALPPDAISIAVGAGSSAAAFTVDDVHAARQVLRWLLGAPPSGRAAASVAALAAG